MAQKKTTLQDVIAQDKAFLTPVEVGDVLGCDPHTLRVTARQRPELMNFPFTIQGNRVKFPRIPFLRFMGVAI